MDSQESWRTSMGLPTHHRMDSEPMFFGLQIQYRTKQLINYEKIGSGFYQSKREDFSRAYPKV